MTMTKTAVAGSHLSRTADGSVGQSPVALPDVDAAQLDRVRALLQADIERGACDGVALRATLDGAPLLAETVGYAERDTGRPLTDDTVLAQFSVSKQFGAVLALMFVERGLLRLHTPVAEVIPEFGCLGKQSINLHHVLTQTTGLPPDNPVPALPMQAWLDNAVAVEHICRIKLLAAPGTRVSYQGFYGHALIAEMLHRLDPAGRSYVELVEQELLSPLGMTDTAMGLTRADLAERFAPVVPRFTDPDLFEPHEHTGMNDLLRAGAVIPGGGYVTTSDDLHTFARMLANGGTLQGTRILSSPMLDYAARNQTGDRPNDLMAYTAGRDWIPWPANIGTGFFVRGEGVSIGPVGLLSGPRTLAGLGSGSAAFVADPDRRLAVSLLSVGTMSETDHFTRVSRLTDMIIAAL